MDAQLMDELKSIAEKINPVDILLVIDSMIGQEALNIAQDFGMRSTSRGWSSPRWMATRAAAQPSPSVQ